ncbi:hypothetical protein GCM10011365_25710 [Marinicella pacifica]|uniref:MacB-like protein n=1 Tax=Marinicella pacifica TaxID=1171543 RepID=A0A917FS58_9GAMM|nr:hypothetical protein [Marinicella pacifica]GGG03414.1 hypothetical protein GCM10011365_25710 [Marinicella pacifica]
MYLPLFLGYRYTKSKRKDRFISFISFASMGGIAIGVMTLIVTISAMNGFEKQLKVKTGTHTPINNFLQVYQKTATENLLLYPEN